MMARTVSLLRLLLLVTLFVGLGSSALAQGETAPAAERTIAGIVKTQDGKPLAHVTLYLFGLPPEQTDMITLGDQSTVVTDDQGHFTWAVPAALPPLSDYIGVRSIECYALAADRSTERFRIALNPNAQGAIAESVTHDLLEQATRSCETKWQTEGAHTVLSVVVPDMSAILLTVRGPNGQPLRGREMQAVAVGLTPDYGGSVVYRGRTDAEGRLRLRCFPGSWQFRIFVPGLGFGSTGTFDTKPGESVAPPMPPLAPFARLSGTVAPTLVGPGAAVHMEDYSNEDAWYDPHGTVDAGGHWTMADVLPGQHRVVLTGGRGESEPVQVTVQTGEEIGGIAVGAKIVRESAVTSAPSLPKAAPAMHGHITDAEGRPAAGADVYAVCGYSEGMEGGQKVLAAKTDAEGMYHIADLPTGNGRTEPFVRLVASQPGFGLAVGDGQSEKGQDISIDLVLPATHSGLAVRAFRDGQPAPGVRLFLTAQGEPVLLSDYFRGGDYGEAAQTLRKMLTPSGVTGPDGVARFRDLSPGLWDVNLFPSPEGRAIPYDISTGVAVRAGESSSFALNLPPEPDKIAFRVFGPNGLPSTAPESVDITTALGDNYGSYPLSPDDKENKDAEFFFPGLFQVTAHIGERSPDNNALAESYDEGSVWVAVSPAIAGRPPIDILTHPVGPASLRVRLQDPHGQPVRGTVSVGDFWNSARYAGSADGHGTVVFPNMAPGKYTVTARFPGPPTTAALSQPGSPPPSDAVLTAQPAQPLPQTVVVRADEEASVTFGPQPPGYMRLRLTGPFASMKNYDIEGRLSAAEDFVDTRLDPVTGEYVLGPLPAGRRTIRLFHYVSAPVEASLRAGETEVTVKSGQVVHAEILAQSTAEQELWYSSPLSGTVLLPDGKTPAWGARAALFVPGQSFPTRMAQADTQGRLTLKDTWRGGLRLQETPMNTFTEPVLAVWLPGSNGAVVVPYQPGRDERIVLPAPVALHGRVTVGGQSVPGLPSVFRVRADCQGMGALDQILSVEAMVQADGTFTLAGLTPGTYRVQAVRDNLYLSETRAVTVGADAPPEITLDIAPPGAPVRIHLTDASGRALAGRTVTLDRPAGPLTGLFWPPTVTADAHGDLRLEGLEAGRQTLDGLAAFTVPAFSGTAAQEAAVQVVALTEPVKK